MQVAGHPIRRRPSVGETRQASPIWAAMLRSSASGSTVPAAICDSAWARANARMTSLCSAAIAAFRSSSVVIRSISNASEGDSEPIGDIPQF
ncbi:hypothetical protein [Pseudonocardia oceani]|uniref:Uncharacterized protein n=1 Tax=Pseudonocardia oceani TaxID=2792013 RepID=A0ABS6U257_9PSEU|nr:hypothetical protein [Pseudonocardia oceani]MBW0126199.1 hypothetical protein [Pseudonocardia oceani]